MKKAFPVLLSLTWILLFAACSPKARLTSSWVDPALNGYSANDVLVIGVSKDETRLKLYENVFVDEFAKHNVRAMASYKVSSTVLEPDRESVEAAVKKSGASAVLVTHVVDRKSETLTLPGTVHYRPVNFYGYYGRAYTRVHMPPTDVTSTVVLLESNLYDVATNSLVWTAQSEAVDPELLRTDFERLVDLLMTDMQKKGVVR